MGHKPSHTVQSKASSTILAPLYLMKRADPLRPIKDSPKTFSLSSALCSEKEARLIVVRDGLSFTDVFS